MAVKTRGSPAVTSPGVRFSMLASASSVSVSSGSAFFVRASEGTMASWIASETTVDGAAALCLARKLLMTAPNSVTGFLFSFSLSAGVVSRTLALVDRVEMSVGVRIMDFTLERVFSGRVVVAGSGKEWPLITFQCSDSNLRTSFAADMQKTAISSQRVWHATCFKVLKNPHPTALFDFTPS